MKLIAKRKWVLKRITEYSVYKLNFALLIVLALTAWPMTLLNSALFLRINLAARIVWGLLSFAFVVLWSLMVYRTVRGLKEGKKVYLSVGNCYLQYEGGVFTCRQITSDGDIQYMEIQKEDIEWILPDKRPGFYLKVKDEALKNGITEISTGKSVAYVLATAYDLDEYKFFFSKLTENVDLRNGSRFSSWAWPNKKKELLKLVNIVLFYCIMVIWGSVVLWLGTLGSSIIFLCTVCGCVFVWRKYGKDKNMDTSSTSFHA